MKGLKNEVIIATYFVPEERVKTELMSYLKRKRIKIERYFSILRGEEEPKFLTNSDLLDEYIEKAREHYERRELKAFRYLSLRISRYLSSFLMFLKPLKLSLIFFRKFPDKRYNGFLSSLPFLIISFSVSNNNFSSSFFATS